MTTISDGRAPEKHSGSLPWVRLKSAASGPQTYRRMLGDVDTKARPGDIVAVYDKSGAPFGVAIYNPKSLIALRLLARGSAATFDLASTSRIKPSRARCAASLS